MDTQIVKDFAREMGTDLVGIGTVDRWDKAPRMLRPQAHLPSAKTVIVMGIHHPDASVEWGGLPNSNYAGPFQIGMIPKLDMMSRKLARFLESNGAEAVPYPCTGFWRHRPYKEIDSTNTASFSHRHAAVACGLGEFGWNNMFMSPQFGPRQRLISVITDADLEPDPLYAGEKLCDRCGMCAKKCQGNNYDDKYLLGCGTDRVCIEDKCYEYAKLNRWRCLWGEQFAFDMDKLEDFNIREEADLFKAAEQGIPRKGGEFGNCLRYCMAKPVRYWDRGTTTAPRRKKEKFDKSTDELIAKVIELAKKNGADRIDIRPLKEVSNEGLKLIDGYPLEKMRDNFSWVISMGRKIPAYPTGHSALEDNENYLKAAQKVRLSIAAYDISAELDNLGYEAMQDWMSIGEIVLAEDNDLDLTLEEYRFGDNEIRPLPLQERYKPAADNTAGVQRESLSMTAGAQTDSGRHKHDAFVSCAVICEAPLKTFSTKIKQEKTADEFIKSIPELQRVQRIGIVSLDSIDSNCEIINFRKSLDGAKNIIVFLAEIPPYIAKLAGKQDAECASTYSYLQYETLRELIWAADDFRQCLEAAGHKALTITDATLSSIRTLAPYWEFSWSKLGHPDPRANAPIAAAAGLGEIGKNGMLLAPGIGPNHRFVFVVTDADLKPTAPYSGQRLCIDCNNCAKTCPVKALDENTTCNICAGDKNYPAFQRNETACEWSRSLGMNPDAGPGSIGWETPDADAPDNISIESAMAAFKTKDPLQVQGYLYPCQIDTLAEACIVNCPGGRSDGWEGE